MRNPSLLLRHPEFLILIAGNVILGMGYALVLPFMSMFGTRELGLGAGGFGIFMTVNAVAGIAISTRISAWSDTRFSRKAVMLVCSALGVAGYVAYAYIRDVRILLPVSCLTLGIAGVTFSQTFAYARDLLARRGVPTGDVPFYINIFRLFYALSWTIGPALGARLLARYSFRATFLATAGLFAAFALLVALGIRATPPAAQSRAAAAGLPLSRAFRLPGFLAHFCAFVLILCCSSMSMMNLPLLILDTLHGNAAQVGNAYSIAPVFELPFMYYVGLLATRQPTARIIRWAAALAIAFYAGLALAQEPWHVYPLQVLSAALVAVNGGLAITFFQDFLPGQAGTATNLYGTAARIGSTGGYLLFGWLGSGLGYRSVFAVCAAFCAAALIIMTRWRPVVSNPDPYPAPSGSIP